MNAHADNLNGHERLLVVTLSNIGDLVMTTPVFEFLATQYPQRRIDVVADQRSAMLLRHAPYVGEIFLRKKRAPITDQLSLLRRLRRRRYLAAIDLRTPLIPYALRADMRLVKPGRKREQHAVEEHFGTVTPLAGNVRAIPACRIYPGDAAVAVSRNWLDVLPGKRWLAVGPGANWLPKIWPRHKYRELLHRARAHFDAAIVLGSKDDCAAAHFVSQVELPVLQTAGHLNLCETAAVLKRAECFVGNDSGLGHIAAACGTPTLTVFGPGQPQRYRPWSDHARIVEAPGSDLAALSSEQVFEELTDFITVYRERNHHQSHGKAWG